MNTSPTADIDPPSNGRLSLAVAAVVLCLAVGGLLVPIPFKGRLAEAFGDFAHAPLFGGLTLGTLALLERWRPSRGIGAAFAMRAILVACGMFAFGVLMELTQKSLSRDGSVHDAIANGMGVLAAVCWFASRSVRRWHPQQTWLRRGLLINCGFLLAIAWWRPLVLMRDFAAMHLEFPLLASFESSAELDRFYFRQCEGQLTHQDATDGDRAMEITYQAKPEPGATMVHLKPDWSGMKSLEMDVALDASATREMRFLVKVIDRLAEDESDLYRRVWTLQPGVPHHLRIERDELLAGPDARELDLSQIRYIDLLVLQPGQSVRLRIDAIRLSVD